MTELVLAYLAGAASGGFVVATGYAIAAVRRLERREEDRRA